MFESARLKLTAWYLLIIMLISMFFSVAIYQIQTSEIERIINRIEFMQNNQEQIIPDGPIPHFQLRRPMVEALENAKKAFALRLIIINGFILFLAGGAGYFLAGRTLRPIKSMIDEQNQFISNASHELRTPIATMRAEMEGSLLEKNVTSKESKELIKSNLEELTKLQELSDKLLQLTRVHAVNMKNYFESSDLQDIVANAQKKVSLLLKKKNIKIINKSKKIMLEVNKHDLTELFVILLDNAIKYSEKNTSITIASEVKKGIVKIIIEDQGKGIEAEDIPHIFERFYRGDKSRNQDGYGLGLAIAKEIVENHKGSIKVLSSPERGTSFRITLPQNH